MDTREIVLDVIAAIGGSRYFWDKCYGDGHPVLAKAETVIEHALGERSEMWKAELRRLVSYILTCRLQNEIGWLEELVHRVNRVCELLGDDDRFAVQRGNGEMWLRRTNR